MSFLRQLLPGMAQTNAAQSEINFDTDMINVEEGQSNRAMVIYDRRNTTRKNRMLPQTPSKRQYREVDDSISLWEQTRTLMAENERLVEQHTILTQHTEEAAQLLRQALMKHEEESKNMQLAQQKFEQVITEHYRSDFAKFQV